MIALFFAVAFGQSQGSFLSPGPLARPHAHLDSVTQCTACHAPLQGVIASRCLACHERVQQQITANAGFHADKKENCQRCHADHRGADFDMVALDEKSFDHRETGFALTGAHIDVDCAKCHTDSATFTGLKQRCSSCHDDVHGAPASTRSLLPECDSCHRTADWMVSSVPASVFDHTNTAQVDYVLEGAHLKVDCQRCHAEAVFVPTQHDGCITCHTDPHRAPFGKKCESCHTSPASWKVTKFDHARTGFVLEGEHTKATCNACHDGHATRPLPHGKCDDCHEDVHSGQFVPDACDSCHTVQIPAFAMAHLDHDRTDFPLRGKHTEAACADCHGKGSQAHYRPLAHDSCGTCHEDHHNGRFEPTPCAVCHVETTWAVADFDHDRTQFPLTGAHAPVPCETCHAGGVYAGLPFASCGDCHTETPHEPTLTQACEVCHETTAFATLHFDHATTKFPLSKPHAVVACEGCHTQTRDFKGTQSTCDGCHHDDRPWGHFPGTCDTCHGGAAWLPAGLGSLDHAVTGFALQGQHQAVACEDCHPAGQPRGSTPDTCGGCHRSDDPHRNLLGEQCNDCHTESGWFKTRFQHVQTGWPLIGLHRVAECSDCHAVAYVGTPTECWRCHEAQAPPDIESHQSPFFVTCDECHNSYNWTAVRFAH